LRHGEQTLLDHRDWAPLQWLEEVQSRWTAEVLVTGYQGELLAGRWEALPVHWTALPLDDWTPALLTQLQQHAHSFPPLAPEAGPDYLRLSEAEQMRALSDRLGLAPAQQ
jgi:hypothetical protein